MTANQRCASNSPTIKFDEGPRQCRADAGHEGVHWAYISDGKHVDSQYDYIVRWNESGFAPPDPDPRLAS